MTTLTQGDLLDYIVENKGNKVFVGWTVDQILSELRRAIAEDSLCYSMDKKGNLTGVVTGRKLVKSDGTKVMHIVSLLTTRPGTLKLFFEYFRTHFPEYKLLQANRRRKIREGLTYYNNIRRFGRLIERLT